jgi:hypothetical protein
VKRAASFAAIGKHGSSCLTLTAVMAVMATAAAVTVRKYRKADSA